ncbi:MAG: class I SAM-dependent methyltransferase [Hyphomicrobiales bacterium]
MAGVGGGAPDPRLVEHRRIWDEKPVLRAIYADYHRRLLDACPPGPLLDIGGGSAHLKAFRPDAVSVDILPFAGIDVACDAHSLPFPDGHFAGIVMLDVLHHLDRPVDFLKEAARVLRPGGALAMIEPGMSAVSYPFFRYLHQEPAEMSADPFAPLSRPGAGKDPFDSNQAIPTLLFARAGNRRRLLDVVPELEPVQTDWLSLVAYPLSGGFKDWCLLPASLAGPLIALEGKLPGAVRRLCGFRLFVTLRRR